MGRGPHGVPSRRRRRPAPQQTPPARAHSATRSTTEPPARGPASPRPGPAPTLIPFSGTLTAPRRIPPISARPSRPSAHPANRFPPLPRPSPPAHPANPRVPRLWRPRKPGATPPVARTTCLLHPQRALRFLRTRVCRWASASELVA